ncbi:CLUMA_CG014511, isoform A [Clunio marinus]|uniref:CLUMA_CG014511, isoform A n=1 Tax=Clunio marinus TaxID=568069 RepID=A0A1J1IM45_9DIPT|nr:CLUMA_CG014511, isoform A [Clunio marinus]
MFRFMPAVRNQGKCGSCWAFSVVSALEYWNAKRGKRLQFSEQDLVDCNTRNKACNGGNPYFAFEYIKHSGISDGRRYKYAEQRQSCRKSQFPSILQIKRFCTGTLNGDENALKSVVANYGPVVVLIRTSNTDFDFYKRGIYDDPKCGSDKRLVDHAVTLVGYGTDSRYGDYWLIRNSWGTSWGENVRKLRFINNN